MILAFVLLAAALLWRLSPEQKAAPAAPTATAQLKIDPNLGGKPTPVPQERPASFSEVAGAWARGEISAREGARRLNVSHTTFLRWSKETNPTVEKSEE